MSTSTSATATANATESSSTSIAKTQPVNSSNSCEFRENNNEISFSEALAKCKKLAKKYPEVQVVLQRYARTKARLIERTDLLDQTESDRQHLMNQLNEWVLANAELQKSYDEAQEDAEVASMHITKQNAYISDLHDTIDQLQRQLDETCQPRRRSQRVRTNTKIFDPSC